MSVACKRSVVEFTDPAVFTTGIAEGWAEPITDPTRIDWAARRAVALLPFEVIDGRPVSPGGPNHVHRGRNGLGRWGENPWRMLSSLLARPRQPDAAPHREGRRSRLGGSRRFHRPR